MYEWQFLIQQMVNEIDQSILRRDDMALTLTNLANHLGYSEFHVARKFREVTGMSLRQYLVPRRLAFALWDVRDTKKPLLDIALDYGFSSHEAFTRAFKKLYGVTPSEYRRRPLPVALRIKLNPGDRYALGMGEIGMTYSDGRIKVYFTTLPAHRFLHVRNDHSNGYWDFWMKQAEKPGEDCETVCGLLDSIPCKLDDLGGCEANSGAGQIMAYINDKKADTFPCWPVARAEAYGVRLPVDYAGPVPEQMTLIDVPEAEYLVFEHGPFDYEQENRTVEERIDQAQEAFDWRNCAYAFDGSDGRMMYFYHDAKRCWRELWPVKHK